MWFDTASDGWVACSGERATLTLGANALVQSSDGGHSWQVVASSGSDLLDGPFGAEPTLIQMFSLTQGFGGGDWGGVQSTSDGGRSWRQIEVPGYIPLDGTVRAWFADPRNGFAVAYDGGVTTLSTTRNGGASWRVLRRWRE